ncbi:uncharacterized protein LOC143642826 isoform X2 [Tamandua tetradactyla]|uniref:uncharacterized protein LOC143642826 isoform X2 n=1 Tax=Tamandua tetradactyla TaxID=48850 RepID=UPI004054432E
MLCFCVFQANLAQNKELIRSSLAPPHPHCHWGMSSEICLIKCTDISSLGALTGGKSAQGQYSASKTPFLYLGNLSSYGAESGTNLEVVLDAVMTCRSQRKQWLLFCNDAATHRSGKQALKTIEHSTLQVQKERPVTETPTCKCSQRNKPLGI